MEGMTIDDPLFKKEIKKMFKEMIEEYLDPDFGLSMRKSFKEKLKVSKHEKYNGKLINFDDVKKELEI